jgi:ABC-type antimicrobial peptide transport system permease subunit
MLLLFYVLRSLRARLRSNAITLLAITLFVLGGTIGLSLYLSLKQSVVDSTPRENIVVLNAGAASEETSRISLETTRRLAVLDGIKHVDGAPLITNEGLTNLTLIAADYTTRAESCRGIDARSFAVHHARIIEGAAPSPGTSDIVLGVKLAKRYPNLPVGSLIPLPGGSARISGIFSTGSGPLDSEVWIARDALQVYTKDDYISSTTLVADSAANVPALITRIKTTKDLDVNAVTRIAMQSQGAGLSTTLRVVLIVLVLLGVVTAFALGATMSAAIIARLPEFASMVAIGYRRSRLQRTVLLESLVLTSAGTAIGIVVYELVRAMTGTFPIGQAVELSASPLVPVIGVGLGLVVGVLAALSPIIAVHRFDVIKAMRT